jgi:hypothetical protein
MNTLYEQFEKEAIAANFSICFAKSEGHYFYSLTQAMFDGWYLRYRRSNCGDNNQASAALDGKDGEL